MTTVNLLEDVSFIEAGLDLISGKKPPLAVLTESQEPALALGLAVSSMDRDFDGRVAGLRCCDVLLLSVFSAKAAIFLSRRLRREEKQVVQLLLLGVSHTVRCTVAFSNQTGYKICSALANAQCTAFCKPNAA